MGSSRRCSVVIALESGELPIPERPHVCLMDTLLAAADAADVPLIVLLGAPQYYGRFGFRPAEDLGVIPPEPEWGDAFQVRPLNAYTASVAGRFQYAAAFRS